MKPLDIYLEFGVDQYNVRSREAQDVVTRFAIRKILRERGLTLREIGRIEGSIDGGEPVHHSSIIGAVKSEDRRVLDEVARIKDELEKWERAEQNAKSVDIKKALRESGAIPASGVHSQPIEELVEMLSREAPAITYVGQNRESTETATERAIREKRQHKEALDRLKMRVDEQKSEAERVKKELSTNSIDSMTELVSEFNRRADEYTRPFRERAERARVVQKPKSLLTRIIEFFTGD